MTHDIVLDRDVRDWVLVPLTASIFLMMLIRQYVTQASSYLWLLRRVSLRHPSASGSLLHFLLRKRCGSLGA